MARLRAWPLLALVGLLLAGAARQAQARPDEAMLAEFKAAYPEFFEPGGDGRLRPAAVPDIFGPGAVLNVGHIYMKVTNFDVIGNPFPGLSSDPSAQWPGLSGVEYLSFILLGVGGVDKTATDVSAVRRVSLQPEWRPETLGPEDRVYRSYDGKVFALRNTDDDDDAKRHLDLEKSQYVDEDFQDGRDNDGDGEIDEDFGAIGQQMFSCAMWDNTIQALQTNANEKHVPIGLELRQTAFAFSVPGFEDFNAITWTIINRSSHAIDSMYVGIRVDMDAGPTEFPAFFNDDNDVPFFPHGDFPVMLSGDTFWGSKMDPRRYRLQREHAVIPTLDPDSAAFGLCPRVNVRVNGFSVADNETDAGRTPGIASVLLLGHTTDPLGLMAPRKVGWTQFRAHVAGAPYASGGSPVVDQQRMEMFASGEGIDPETGFINALPVDQEGDIQSWASIGPFGNTDYSTGQARSHPIPIGGSIELTIAFAVQNGDLITANQYPADYAAYLGGQMTPNDLFAKYPALENAFAAQVAYEGVYDDPPSVLADAEHINVPDFHGRETRLRAGPGESFNIGDCREEGITRRVDEFSYQWFDFDCDYCTGVWAFGSGPDFGNGPGSGKMLKRWNTAAPPPNPETNVSAIYNFTDNPGRVVKPGQDKKVVLAWDNLPETTVDPEAATFDFRSYRLWKVSNWRRTGGVTGPSDDDWTLLAQYRFFDYYDLQRRHLTSNRQLFTNAQMTVPGRRFWPSAIDSVNAGIPICPQVYIPNLSLQTIVLEKSAFTKLEAKSWVQSNGYSAVESDVTEAATTWRFRQAEGECRSNSFHTVGLEGSTVSAEVCLNPLAPSRGFIVPICLNQGDLWDRQTGDVMRPAPATCPERAPNGTCLVDTIPCLKNDFGDCLADSGKIGVGGTILKAERLRYPVGRYRYVDEEVKNGFIYFYAITAGDSTGGAELGDGSGLTSGFVELTGRRSAVEAEGVYPQGVTRTTGKAWVVPNPYRGYANLDRRPSGWDLTPNATDPTGTHLDFLGLPPPPWTIQIFTVSGDLVQVLRSSDPVNDSVRGPVTVPNPTFNPNLPVHPVNNPKTISLPGFNRQADSANDGQARWNLISRSGQDVVSGVYIFVVESGKETQRGKFVVIR